MGISELKEFRPSIKEEFYQSWYLAKGLRFPFLRGFWNARKCCVCNRKEDYLFNFTKLIPYFDASQFAIFYICDDHGQITDYDCTTGLPVQLPLPKPYWQRQFRNIIQQAILNIAYVIRFIYFFSYNIFMWYIFIYPYYWYRQCKKS